MSENVVTSVEKRCRERAARIRKTRSRRIDHEIAELLDDAAAAIDLLKWRIDARERDDGNAEAFAPVVAAVEERFQKEIAK